MSLHYLDTSVAVAALLGDADATEWFDSIANGDEPSLVSSRLLQTELTRVLRREGRSVAERALVLDYVQGVPLTDAILTAAEAITEHVKTLDAIHLASALALGSEVVVVSHDATMLRLAAVLGLRVVDPMTTDPRGRE